MHIARSVAQAALASATVLSTTRLLQGTAAVSATAEKSTTETA